MPMVGVGYGNYVAVDKIVALVSANSKPVRQMIRNAREQGILIDATVGKRMRTVIIMASNQIVISANTVRTILQRLNLPPDKDALHSRMIR